MKRRARAGVRLPVMKWLSLLLSSSFLVPSLVLAQGPRPSDNQGPRPTDIAPSKQPVGDAGIMWYTTWDTALSEAKRSQRPIFFMAAAATCSGISGVF